MEFLHKIRRIRHSLTNSIRSTHPIFEPSHSSYKWLLLANIMIGTFMAVLDATIVNVGLPKIMASFGVSIDKIEWVVTAYMLSLAIMLPTAGWLADKFGYKKIYFLSLALFTFGSMLCGLSTDENMLIMARIIQGLGAGGIQPIGMAIITREFPPKQRGVALGFWSIASAASVSFGPLIGGYLVDNFYWQLIFDVNVPVGILGLISTLIIQREYKNKNLRKFDIVGFISVSLFLPLTLYALSEGTAQTNSAGWDAPYILICFAIAIISLAIFITAELVVDEPLLDLKLLKDRNFGISNIIMFIFGIGMFGSTFLLPLFMQNSLGYTAYQAGLVFLPTGFIQGSVSPFVGRLSDKYNGKVFLVIGILLLSFSFYLNYYLSYLTENSFIMLSLYIRGFAMGMIFTPLSSMSLYGIKREKMAQASGLFNVVRQLGGSFGIAIFTTIFTTRINYHLQMYGTEMNKNSPTFQNVIHNFSYMITNTVGSNFAQAAQQGQSLLSGHLSNQAYIQGINDDFLLSAIITLVAIVPIFFLHNKNKKR